MALRGLRNNRADRGEHALARGERRVEVEREELLLAIDVNPGHAADVLTAGDDVLGAVLADELEDVHGDLIVRGVRKDLHGREIAGRGTRSGSASAEQKRACDKKAKARAHAHI